ncbi:hypothetical protein [Candidatus Parabeggiatoa sp. HSG14]|uniref:hypothetical protein n=1 Tax=Candidatus Parabeggiatoa sp. HSG14 TaxID=3055593 RepID=UPI0025A6E84E|nr:hypothetical protein [Thiotrichales bacterium HSG14]
MSIGGTKNSNAKNLQARCFNCFWHIEMSKSLREKLRGDNKMEFGRDAMLASLA